MMEEIWHSIGQLQGEVATLKWLVTAMWPAIIGIYVLLIRNGKKKI